MIFSSAIFSPDENDCECGVSDDGDDKDDDETTVWQRLISQKNDSI